MVMTDAVLTNDELHQVEEAPYEECNHLQVFLNLVLVQVMA